MKQNSRLKALIILDNKLDVNIEMSHLSNGFSWIGGNEWAYMKDWVGRQLCYAESL